VRSLEPRGESVFVPFDDVTGRLRVVWQPGQRFTYDVYARRALIYSVREAESAPYYVADVVGVGVGTPVGWRVRLRAFVEAGRNGYTMRDPSAETIRDDIVGFGVVANVELGRGMRLMLAVSRETYDSTLPGRDRDILRLTTTLGRGQGLSPWY
jgi:hypothetical protein